jgi:hypothetical protein
MANIRRSMVLLLGFELDGEFPGIVLRGVAAEDRS